VRSGVRGVILEIPPFVNWNPNLRSSSGRGTMSGGQFDWGGRLLKSNGGALRFPQPEWKPGVECKRIRELNCKANTPSRCESRC
jgi:hypothetical protein